MAIRKHAMTKVGAIVCITRSQIKKIREQGGDPNGKVLKDQMGINSTFVDTYIELPDSKIKELYKNEFGIELEIVNR
jgi:hypothetical protein